MNCGKNSHNAVRFYKNRIINSTLKSVFLIHYPDKIELIKCIQF